MKPSLLTRLSLSFFLSIAAFSPLAADEGKAPPPQHLKPVTKELIEQLNTGGHVLIVRHERTNAFIPDTKEVDLNNCATQRNLSIAGHANAVENYRALSFLQIPIGQVYASPTCRTLETARLMFGRVEAHNALYRYGQGSEQLSADLKELIRSNAKNAENAVLVTHLGTYAPVFGGHLAEGDAAVFSLVNDRPQLQGVIPANGWNDAIIDAVLAAQ